MFGKYAVVFFLAFCAAQGFNDYNVSESRSLESLLKDFKDLIDMMEAIIKELPKFINNMIRDLRSKIKEAIESIDIGGITNGIEDKIEDILNSTGIDASAARHCINAEEVLVVNLLEDVSAKVEKCRLTAEESVNKLEKELNSLVSNARSLVRKTAADVAQCVFDDLNPIKQTKCLTDLQIEVTKKTNALLAQIGQTVVMATKTAADISLNVVTCTAGVNADIIKGQLQIIENFQTCVENINQ